MYNAFTYHGESDSDTDLFLQYFEPDPVVYGWWTDHEGDWIKRLTKNGAAGVPADWCENLSTYSRLPVEIPKNRFHMPDPPQDGERIVCFVMSDGDNLQWTTGNCAIDSRWWASPLRGTFNMTWALPPTMVPLQTRALKYFYDTASNGTYVDNLICAPSGVGYYRPGFCTPAIRADLASHAGPAMAAANFRVLNILDTGTGITQAYELMQNPEVIGAVYKSAPHNYRGDIYWVDGKPCVAFLEILWEGRTTPSSVASYISTIPNQPRTNERSYAAIFVHCWSFYSLGGPLNAVQETINQLPPNTRVVTAEQMITMLRNQFGEPYYGPYPPGDFDKDQDVDAQDFKLLAQTYLNCNNPADPACLPTGLPAPATCQDVIDNYLMLDADISGPMGTPDCYIDLFDYAPFSQNWQTIPQP